MEFLPKLPTTPKIANIGTLPTLIGKPSKQPNVMPLNVPIPKLRVAPIISPIKLSDVIQYFENFGEIEYYDIRRDQFFDCIIIKFKNAEDIGTILKKRYHRIQKYIMTVELASDQFLQTIHTKNLFTKKVSFIDINNKILSKIFENLCVNDLCSIANTCTRFEKMAQQMFKAKFNKITWRAGDTNAMNVFNTFGRFITSLDVDVIGPNQNEFLEFIAETCDYNLSHLNLWMQNDRIIGLTEETTMKLKLLFSQLYRLDLYCHQLFNLRTTRDLFASCLELKSLAINCMSDTNFELNSINVKFPKLEELKFYINNAISDGGLELLLFFNPNIKKLYLDECRNLTARAIDVIVHRLPNLEVLSLGFLLQKVDVQELRPLGELKRLNSLNVILGPALGLINVIYESGTLIESLMLWYVRDMNDALVERVGNMETITSLIIYSNDHALNFAFSDSHLGFLALNLPALTEMRLGYSEYVTIDGLKNFLFYAKNLTILTLTCLKNVTAANKYDLLDYVGQRPNLTIDIE